MTSIGGVARLPVEQNGSNGYRERMRRLDLETALGAADMTNMQQHV
jgi:hypothetical protein